MNHRKAIPANGMRLSASAAALELPATHAPDASGSAGMALKSNPKLARVSREKTTPVMAAGFGVFSPGLGETVDLAHALNSSGDVRPDRNPTLSIIIFEPAWS